MAVCAALKHRQTANLPTFQPHAGASFTSRQGSSFVSVEQHRGWRLGHWLDVGAHPNSLYVLLRAIIARAELQCKRYWHIRSYHYILWCQALFCAKCCVSATFPAQTAHDRPLYPAFCVFVTHWHRFAPSRNSCLKFRSPSAPPRYGHRAPACAGLDAHASAHGCAPFSARSFARGAGCWPRWSAIGPA